VFYLLLIIFSVVNSFMYLSFFRFDIRKIYRDRLSYVVLLLYALRTLSVILVAVMITTNLTLIREAAEFISQEDFFENYKDYYYTNIGYIPREGIDGKPEKTLEDNAKIKEIFYEKNYNEFKPIRLVSLGDTYKNDIIYANQNSLTYLCKEIKSLNASSMEKKCCYILPFFLKDQKNIVHSLDLKMENYLEKDIVGNPFITIYDRDIMYKINDSSFSKFIDEYDLASEIHGKSRTEISIEDALKMVGLEDKLNQKVYSLSGGEQQRVALARLMLKKCNLILADEPTFMHITMK
jgi:ABC-type dipeptide/oligopeptide/nickel transport system ATPase subunit